MAMHFCRDPALCERDLARYRAKHHRLFPALEQTPDISRGEQRFAAEVTLAEFNGVMVPGAVHARAVATLRVIANG